MNNNILSDMISEKKISHLKKLLNEEAISVLDAVIVNPNVSNEEVLKDVEGMIQKLNNRILPYDYPSWTEERFWQQLIIRDIFTEKIGFALISEKFIKKLAEWIGERKCLEIMSGTGALAASLKKEGVSCIATDNFSWGEWNFTQNYWTEIENIDCLDAIEKYAKEVDIVIMSWCPMEDIGYEALMKMREVNPNLIMLMIGEGEGGCTGSNLLYENLIVIEHEETMKLNEVFRCWDGIHDRVWIIK